MTKAKDRVFAFLEEQSKQFEKGVTASELASLLNLQRSNVSRYLNELVKDKRLKKSKGRPVRYVLSYLASDKTDKDAFDSLTGSDGSLKSLANLARATILYPDKSLNTLIIGAQGTEVDYLAKTMHQFAKDKGLLASEAPFITVDCLEDGEQENWLDLQEYVVQADDGVLFLRNIEQLSAVNRQKVLELTLLPKKSFYLICSISDNLTGLLKESFSRHFSVKLELPPLNNRPLKERLAFVKMFFFKEAGHMSRDIIITSEVLRSLLLYPCEKNINQLYQDIRVACANAFVRHVNHENEAIRVYMHDFSSAVRKGFLFYSENRDEIEQIIPEDFSYTFSKNSSLSRKANRMIKGSQTIYDKVEKKVHELNYHGFSEEEMTQLLSDYVESNVEELTRKHDLKEADKESLTKVVDKWLVDNVEEFLTLVSHSLERTYTITTLYNLCLHLSAAIEHKAQSLLSQEKKERIEANYPLEYQLAQEFVGQLEGRLSSRFSDDLTYFVTLFIVQKDSPNHKKPAVLIVMHGSSTASSISQVVNTLIKDQEIYAYDLLLDKKLEQAYEELKHLIQQIDNGKGVLVLYDMGSIRTMTETIHLETGIVIKYIEMPITLLAMEAMRNINEDISLDQLHQMTLDNVQKSFDIISHSYQRQKHGQAIVTLCSSGEGAALAMKDYLEKNLIIEDTDIVTLALNDKQRLISEINRVRKEYDLLGIVGTYNPNLVGIPFVSISDLYRTPVELLEFLFYTKDSLPYINDNYDAIYRYLKEQQPSLNITSLKRYLPMTMRRINKLGLNLSEGQEVGLFVHIACLISRLQSEESVPKNTQADSIISSNKRLYFSLKEILKNLEEEFTIVFTDDELANIISIIKEI